MLLPLSWLNEYVDISDISPEKLEEKLFDIGFEVEEKHYLGEEISNCVVGQIKSITKHPDSDHLQICILDCGSFGENIQIVTGAQNVFEGAKVPVALHNSTLAGGVKIKNGKLRGVESNGMLCSGGELGITEDFYKNAGVDGILILPNDTKIGEDIKKVVGLDDWVFDLKINPNRPDAESIVGIAREVAVVFEKQLKLPSLEFKTTQSDKKIAVSVEDKQNCPKYLAHLVENVNIQSSPAWMKQRLIKSGVNAINNIVDITNYVLKEFGQPMHAFDYLKLKNQTIIVRRAKDGEILKTLDEKENSLTTNNLVIADAEKPVALAGVMGGFDSGVQDDTTTIVFESAKFMRENVRKTSRALGIASDSSHRFEKGVDEFSTTLAMKRALNLIDELGAGNVTNVEVKCEVNPNPIPQVIKSSVQKINNILGIEVPKDVVESILTRLGFEIDMQLDGTFSATVPLWRTDLDGTADLSEEVIRIYGFSHITPRLLDTTHITNGGLNAKQQLEERTKNLLAGIGLNEIITYSFCGERHLDLLKLPQNAPERNFVKIANPLTSDIAIMKTTLVCGMLEVISNNFKHGVEDGKFFELANVYFPKEVPMVNLPTERKTLTLGAFGEDETFFTFKGYLESLCEVFKVKLTYEKTEKSFLHPYVSAEIKANGEVVGVLGQVRYEVLNQLDIATKVFVAELDYEKLSSIFNTQYSYLPVSKFPAIKRDLAIVVKEEIASGQVEDVIRQTSKKVSEIKLFDVFRSASLGENKSLAYTLVFESGEEAITHEEVDAQIKKILNRLQAILGAVLRS